VRFVFDNQPLPEATAAGAEPASFGGLHQEVGEVVRVRGNVSKAREADGGPTTISSLSYWFWLERAFVTHCGLPSGHYTIPSIVRTKSSMNPAA
jgi:hypothetical protein